jgi:hypothetical protein
MKLEQLEIRNFRGIESLSLSLTDELGLIRNRVPIVGPNTSGKTTILDAIALCLMPVTELYQFRDGLRLTPSSLVRRGAVHASVSCTVWFSEEEVEAAREVAERAGIASDELPPVANRVEVHWTFPDPKGRQRTGYYRCEPWDGWKLFKGRKVLADNLHVPGLGSRDFRRLGGVILFDQQRTGLAKKLTSYERVLLGHLLQPEPGIELRASAFAEPSESAGPGDPDSFPVERTTDPRFILTSLAMRAQVAQSPDATEKEAFQRLCELYERVCRPHKVGGLYNTDHGLDMEFIGERGAYYYDGLSSGQQMVLLLLLQFATRRIHQSIVLIDEIELHLHPLWQDRLYTALPDLGIDNQFIFTTHSTHLRDMLHGQFQVGTGVLESAANR